MGQGTRGMKFHTLMVNWREKGSTHLQEAVRVWQGGGGRVS